MKTIPPLNALLDLPVPGISPGDGPLTGETLAVKDIFDVAGMPTGCGNPQKYGESPPATTTAPAVQNLIDAGARFVGKTQTDELAFSMMGQNTHFPHPVNPRAPDRVTGGSSSGSVAAVAGGLASIGVGSDTGGSIRAPASFCGVVGLRTTHGRISLAGTMPLAHSLDTFGWFARDITLYEKVGGVLLGPDRQDFKLNRPLFIPLLEHLLLGEAEDTEYRRMYAILAAHLGHARSARQATASMDDLYLCLRQIQGFEAWAAHGEWISQKERNLGPAVRERFEYGSTIDDDTYRLQTRRRDLFRNEFTDLLRDDGILVLPTVPGAAPLVDTSFDDSQAYRERCVRLFCLSGLSGFPQITLPLGKVHGAPFGISLIGPEGSDRALIRLGKTILQAADAT
ncbi:amidase [Phyllobacterium endophyticum]|uniref:Amidase n=1 Tax=Phyllobacterium endophyticum TaxID=1149773 RepID=A0A2P7AKX0_9HYPH|nr:amidase [Phyllobacterium endophyticum]MBB3233240.1 amidase [Phyllobacterium endophyticum]PSH54871.1 amidase [Phyllobacterium endophyticum]TYR43260.1 amidase [Phyllobacterium endophyticum]